MLIFDTLDYQLGQNLSWLRAVFQEAQAEFCAPLLGQEAAPASTSAVQQPAKRAGRRGKAQPLETVAEEEPSPEPEVKLEATDHEPAGPCEDEASRRFEADAAEPEPARESAADKGPSQAVAEAQPEAPKPKRGRRKKADAEQPEAVAEVAPETTAPTRQTRARTRGALAEVQIQEIALPAKPKRGRAAAAKKGAAKAEAPEVPEPVPEPESEAPASDAVPGMAVAAASLVGDLMPAVGSEAAFMEAPMPVTAQPTPGPAEEPPSVPADQQDSGPLMSPAAPIASSSPQLHQRGRSVARPTPAPPQLPALPSGMAETPQPESSREPRVLRNRPAAVAAPVQETPHGTPARSARPAAARPENTPGLGGFGSPVVFGRTTRTARSTRPAAAAATPAGSPAFRSPAARVLRSVQKLQPRPPPMFDEAVGLVGGADDVKVAVPDSARPRETDEAFLALDEPAAADLDIESATAAEEDIVVPDTPAEAPSSTPEAPSLSRGRVDAVVSPAEVPSSLQPQFPAESEAVLVEPLAGGPGVGEEPGATAPLSPAALAVHLPEEAFAEAPNAGGELEAGAPPSPAPIATMVEPLSRALDADEQPEASPRTDEPARASEPLLAEVSSSPALDPVSNPRLEVGTPSKSGGQAASGVPTDLEDVVLGGLDGSDISKGSFATARGSSIGGNDGAPEAGISSDGPRQDIDEAAAHETATLVAPQAGSKAGFASNLVGAVRSFLPSFKAADPEPAAGKKVVKVKALEAAEAARRKDAQKAAERAKQKEDVEKQRGERMKLAQEKKAKLEEEARLRQEDTRRKREEQAVLLKRQREDQEKRRFEEIRQKRKQEEAKRKADAERDALARAAEGEKVRQAEEDRKRKASKLGGSIMLPPQREGSDVKKPRMEDLLIEHPAAPVAPPGAAPAAAPAAGPFAGAARLVERSTAPTQASAAPVLAAAPAAARVPGTSRPSERSAAPVPAAGPAPGVARTERPGAPMMAFGAPVPASASTAGHTHGAARPVDRYAAPAATSRPAVPASAVPAAGPIAGAARSADRYGAQVPAPKIVVPAAVAAAVAPAPSASRVLPAVPVHFASSSDGASLKSEPRRVPMGPPPPVKVLPKPAAGLLHAAAAAARQAALASTPQAGMMKSSQSRTPGSGRHGMPKITEGSPAVPSYEISPFRGSDEEDESDDDEIPKKPVPDWARGQALHSQILAQFRVDPDEIFHYHEESCNLDDVFAGNSRVGKNGKKKDWNRRTSSANWVEDKATLKEEQYYRNMMGYGQ